MNPMSQDLNAVVKAQFETVIRVATAATEGAPPAATVRQRGI